MSKPTQIPVFRAVIPPEGAGHDADTLDVWLDQWFGDWKHRANIRLEGVNAAELSHRDGLTQRDFVRAMLPPGTRLILRTKVSRKDIEVQSFQRYVGELWLRDEDLVVTQGSAAVSTSTEVSLNRWLVWANVLAAWDGRSRPTPVPEGPIREEAWEWLQANRPGFDREWTL